MKIRIYQGRNGQWNIQVRARNGNVLLAGTGYNRRASAVKTVRNLCRKIQRGLYDVITERTAK